MENNIKRLENALRQIDTAKKQLSRNTAEAKSRIQGGISRQLEALRNREVWLLNQLDTVSGAKEEILQQQSARLNKTLGVLQSSLTFPQDTESSRSSSLERLDLTDLVPEETPYISFKCEPAKLRTAIMDFGKVVSTAVSPLQSPFVAPGDMAPSLPKHFEEYEDADHHVLYKTVEEINRARTEKPFVYVNIPKLSTRIEDWLLYPSSAANCSQSSSSYLGSNPPYNVSEWLTTTGPRADSVGLEKLSTDASIQNWLYKIKQYPMEEEEEDFEFIDEMSDNKPAPSSEEFPQPPSPVIAENLWLYGSGNNCSRAAEITFMFKLPDLPQEMWLLKTDDKPNMSPELQIDMSRYFTNISDELDKWLFKGSEDPLSTTLEQAISDNPWLMSSRTNTTRSRSQSPSYSIASSTAGLKAKKNCSANKWLLPNQSDQLTYPFSCPFMEKYIDDMKDLNWLKTEQFPPGEHDLEGFSNPFSVYDSQHSDLSKWLRPAVVESTVKLDDINPLSSLMNMYNGMTTDDWLLGNEPSICDSECKIIGIGGCDDEEGKWLLPLTCHGPFVEENVIDCEDLL